MRGTLTMHYRMVSPFLALCRIRGRQSAGFTLIELLVVLVILGVVSSLVTLAAWPDPRREAENEAARLQLVLELAAQEAHTSGRPIAWVAEGVGYRFMQADLERRWQAVTDDEYLRPRRLAEGMRIAAIYVDGQPLPAGTWLVFASTATPLFRVDMASGRSTYELRARANGRIDLLTRNSS
jgi:general secretion pathway protein H